MLYNFAMHTFLCIGAAWSPRSLVLNPPMTDAELFEFCALNDISRIERTKEGVIHMNAPAGGDSSSGNSEITTQLRSWWKTHKRGRVYDSNAGFHLPDGSMLSPDAAYLTAEKLALLTREDRKGFPHVCPDFVIELLSETDRFTVAKKKMEQWIGNGVQVGWLVVPKKRQVLVYSSGSEGFIPAKGSFVDGSGPVAGFRLDLAEVWECYDI